MELESSIKFLFSPDFNFFAQIEAGKNIRVSEVNSKKEYNFTLDTESGSTNISEICKIPASGKNVVVIANDQGAIQLYDFKSKSQEAELEGHVSRVLSLKVQEETGFLFSVSADKKIIKWDLSSFQPVESFEIDRKGTVSEVTCDFIQDDLSILVSLDNKIIQYNMQLQKVEKKFKGHPTHVNLLKSAAGSKYFASCSNEDAIYVWNTEKDIPVLSLPILSQIFTSLDFCKVSKGHFLVLASSPSQLKLWLLRVTKSEVQIKNAINVQFQDRDLLQAKIYDKRSLIVWNNTLAVYEENRPKFHIIPLFQDAESSDLKSDETIINDISSAINQQGTQDAADDGKKKKKGNKDKVSYHVVGETDENVLEQYRAIRGDVVKNGEKNGEDFFLLDSIKSKDSLETMQTESMDSLAVVLIQALQNNDVQLMDYCFENEDEDLIENTVRKLAQSKVLALLDKITERIDLGKKGNLNLFTWLNFVVKHHSGFLIRSPETANKVAPLIALLQKRVLAVDQIYNLKGKIDMVLNVEHEVKRQKKNQRKLHIEHQPLVIYEEGEAKRTIQTKPSKTVTFTPGMEEFEDEEEKGDKEFSDSISDSEGNIDEEFDAYLQAGADDYDEGQDDDDKESDDSYIGLE